MKYRFHVLHRVSPKFRMLIKAGGLAGIAGPAIAMSLVLYSVSISSWFTWQGNSLSDLGVSSAAVYFNSGLIIEGALNLLFACAVWSAVGWTGLKHVAGPLFGVSGVSLGFVGVFTEHSGSLHGDFALGFFILYPLSLIALALIMRREGPFFALVSAVTGIVALVAIFGTPHRSGALAIPEILEASILSIWTVATGFYMTWRGSLPVSAPSS